MKPKWKYYVYTYSDKSTGDVFYIGKGSGDRWKSMRKRNPYFLNKVSKLGDLVEVNLVCYFQYEEDAYSFEVQLISEIGLETLTNMTDGGEGFTSEYVGRMTRDRCKAGTNGFQLENRRLESSKRQKRLLEDGVHPFQEKGFRERNVARQISEGKNALIGGKLQSEMGFKFKVKNTETDQIYEFTSIRKCSEELSISYGAARNIFNGGTKPRKKHRMYIKL